MLRNFDVTAVDNKKKPIVENDKEVMLSTSIASAVRMDYADERGVISFDEKLKRCKLADRIEAGGNIDINTDEQALIKTLCGKGLPIFIIGQIAELLEKEVSPTV